MIIEFLVFILLLLIFSIAFYKNFIIKHNYTKIQGKIVNIEDIKEFDLNGKEQNYQKLTINYVLNNIEKNFKYENRTRVKYKNNYDLTFFLTHENDEKEVYLYDEYYKIHHIPKIIGCIIIIFCVFVGAKYLLTNFLNTTSNKIEDQVASVEEENEINKIEEVNEIEKSEEMEDGEIFSENIIEEENFNSDNKEDIKVVNNEEIEDDVVIESSENTNGIQTEEIIYNPICTTALMYYEQVCKLQYLMDNAHDIPYNEFIKIAKENGIYNINVVEINSNKFKDGKIFRISYDGSIIKYTENRFDGTVEVDESTIHVARNYNPKTIEYVTIDKNDMPDGSMLVDFCVYLNEKGINYFEADDFDKNWTKTKEQYSFYAIDGIINQDGSVTLPIGSGVILN